MALSGRRYVCGTGNDVIASNNGQTVTMLSVTGKGIIKSIYVKLDVFSQTSNDTQLGHAHLGITIDGVDWTQIASGYGIGSMVNYNTPLSLLINSANQETLISNGTKHYTVTNGIISLPMQDDLSVIHTQSNNTNSRYGMLLAPHVNIPFTTSFVFSITNNYSGSDSTQQVSAKSNIYYMLDI